MKKEELYVLTYNTALLTQKLIYCFINKKTHYL